MEELSTLSTCARDTVVILYLSVTVLAAIYLIYMSIVS
jgi:hypothetical protein